ncbi:DNA polymerase IV 2 [Bacteroidia bacterium]|nr:DNA polymerase IV 2 [Bacteroidia bacterium]
MRKIIHIDMDAFYASVEQRDNPELRGKPIAVGHGEARGVICTASYEARRLGIRSAMPSLTALHKCPELIFVPPRFEAYHEVSMQIRKIFLEYTDLVEPLSLDEAFLDVTVNHKNNPSATLIAQEILQKIFAQTALTASAGVSVNKFLAKIASDWKKPNGLFVIPPQEAEKFVETLPVEKFFGVGRMTAQKMHDSYIFTGGDLKQHSESTLVRMFGKAGHSLYLNARGIDEREVEPNRIIKSVSSETTFAQDKNNRILLTAELYPLAKEVMERMNDENFYGKTITLKIKYADFKSITRSKTLPQTITDFQALWHPAREIMKQIDLSQQPVRLIGIGVSNASDDAPVKKYTQLELKLF